MTVPDSGAPSPVARSRGADPIPTTPGGREARTGDEPGFFWRLATLILMPAQRDLLRRLDIPFWRFIAGRVRMNEAAE